MRKRHSLLINSSCSLNLPRTTAVSVSKQPRSVRKKSSLPPLWPEIQHSGQAVYHEFTAYRMQSGLTSSRRQEGYGDTLTSLVSCNAGSLNVALKGSKVDRTLKDQQPPHFPQRKQSQDMHMGRLISQVASGCSQRSC